MTDTIFAPLTLKGKCSLFVIRISGSKVNCCLNKLGVKTQNLQAGKTYLRNIFLNKELLDQIILLYFKAPHSFTGEDICELHLHCSSYIIEQVYNILLKIEGVRLAENGEFSKRAFLNGKIDLVNAEGICDLVNSKNKIQHQQAIRQLTGETSNFFNDLRQQLLNIHTSFEILIDFPEDEIDENLLDKLNYDINNFKKQIRLILDDNNVTEKIKDGLNIAIIGEPNVGKSSFMNFLAKRDVAIVSNIAGTTRDIISVELEIGGFFVNVFDTAGIRKTNDEIENEGIKRAKKTAEESDLKIIIVDVNSYKNINNFYDFINNNSTIILFNKIDTLTEDNLQIIKNNFSYDKCKIFFVSLKDKIGLGDVLDYIKTFIENNYTTYINSSITQQRYRIELQKAFEYIDRIDFYNQPIEINAENIRSASFCLGKITGQINTEEILNNIFSKFCIGK